MSLKAPDEPSSRDETVRGGGFGGGSPPGRAARGIDAYTSIAGIARGENASLQLARSPEDTLPSFVVLKCPREGRDDTALTLEATALAQVQSPFIVRAFERGLGPLPYLALEYVEGLSVREIVALEPSERRIRFVIPAMVDALRGLQTLHAHGLFHQAPCLRHIMVGVDGQAKLIDLAHAAGTLLPMQQSGLRPGEMAPEQVIAPENVDARCDVFILAVALWEALTGQRPFAADRGEQAVQELLRAPIAPPSQVAPHCPPHFDRLLERALQRAPWKRFASAAEMADLLEETARRHGLYASREETASWVRSLIARPSDGHTPERPSIRAVANLTGTSASGATARPASSPPSDGTVPPPATPSRPIDGAGSKPRRPVLPDFTPTPAPDTVEVAQSLAMLEAFPALPSVDDEDTFVPPSPRRSRAANVLGVLVSAGVLVAGGVALRERLTPRQPQTAPSALESSRPHLPPGDRTPTPAPVPTPSAPSIQPAETPDPARTVAPVTPPATTTDPARDVAPVTPPATDPARAVAPVTPPATAPARALAPAMRPAAAPARALAPAMRPAAAPAPAAKPPAAKPPASRAIAKPQKAMPPATTPSSPAQAAPTWKGGPTPATPLRPKPVTATPWVSGGTTSPN